MRTTLRGWMLAILVGGIVLQLRPARSFASEECRFRHSFPLISLSAPVSTLLAQLPLSQRKSWVAAHKHHGLNQTQFSGTLLEGGLHISPHFLRQHQGAVLFFDEGQEYRRLLSSLVKRGEKIRELVEIRTVGDPFEIYE